MFSDPIECYEAIANEIEQIASRVWRRVEVTADHIGEASIETKVVFISFFGKRKGTTNFIMIPRILFELAKMVSKPEKGECKKILFKMDKNGKFDVSFEY